jgi:hypothetical protein
MSLWYFIPFLCSFISIFLSPGSQCYRKNPGHFKEFSHGDATATSTIPKVTTTGLLIIAFFFFKFS